jgi:O-antigen/teichoic acid export membrane protein
MEEAAMKGHLSNAAYGMLDYGAFPLGMLVVAPVLLHNVGVAQYGVWTMASAVVSIGGVVASGFGDANIQYIAMNLGTTVGQIRKEKVKSSCESDAQVAVTLRPSNAS